MLLQADEAKVAAAQGGDRREGTFDSRTVLTVSLAHFVHDTYPAFVAPLLPLLIPRLGIPLAAAGALVTIIRIPSLIQPFLGVWADRAHSRYFVVVAPTLTAISMSLLGIAPSYLAVAGLLLVSGMSVSIFHPAAAATVTRHSGQRWGRGTSVFQFGGEMGRSFGPLVIVAWIGWFGVESSYWMAIPGVLFSVVLYFRLARGGSGRMKGTTVKRIWESMKQQRRPLLLLSVMVFFQSIYITSFAAFYPTFLTGRGSDLTFAGLSLSLYGLAGALGALAGGTLSDTFGRRTLLLVSQLISAPLLYLTLGLPDGPVQLAVLAVAGAMAMSAAPVQLTLAQETLPNGRSTATGILSLLDFGGTLFSSLAVGFLADWIGLGPALGFSLLASMLCIPFTLALREPRGSC